MIRLLYCVSFPICILSALGCAKTMSSQKTVKDALAVKYTTPGNELEDDLLYLKKNGRFVFFRKNVLVPIVRTGIYEGTYKLKQDTVIFNWQEVEPSNIRNWLSHQCLIDSETKSIHFLNGLTLLTTKTMIRKK